MAKWFTYIYSFSDSFPLWVITRYFPGGASGEEPACQCRRCKTCGFNPWAGTIPCGRKWQPTPVFLLGNPMDRGAWWAYSGLIGLQRVGHNWATWHASLSCSSSVSSWPQLCIMPTIFNGLFWQEQALGFPGGPVVKTPRFPCRGCGFHPWSGKILHAAWHGQREKEKNQLFLTFSCYPISRDFMSKNCNLPHLLPSLFFPVAFPQGLKFTLTSLATLWLDAFCMLLLESSSCTRTLMLEKTQTQRHGWSAWDEASLGGPRVRAGVAFSNLLRRKRGGVRSNDFLRCARVWSVALTQLETFLHTIQVVSHGSFSATHGAILSPGAQTISCG